MPIYSYEALKQGRIVVKGEVTASNLKDARDIVRKMGYVPIKINEFNSAKKKTGSDISSLSLKEKIEFSLIWHLADPMTREQSWDI